MSGSAGRATGRVYAHVGQPFAERQYDVLVVGAGRMGLACAFYLRQLNPDARVLIVERGGIPSEDGATLEARGVWHGADLPAERRAQADWVRSVWADPAAETGVARPHDPGLQEVGWARLEGADGNAQATTGEPPEGLERLSVPQFLSRLPGGAREQLAALADVRGARDVLFDPRGAHGSAATLALSYGYGAVRLGADLLLNTDVRLAPGGALLRRLDITRTMQVVVAQTLTVRAEHVIVAAGAHGPELLEEDLGIVTLHGRAFAQFPRLRLTPEEGLPVLEHAGVTVRPGGGGLRVLLPPLPADPHGYSVTPGRLGGVPVGVRREVLEALLGAMDAWPALAEGALDLGRAPSDVPGAWEVRPRGGWPLHETPEPGVTLLLGGPEADRVGLAVAYDCAARIAGHADRPWS